LPLGGDETVKQDRKPRKLTGSGDIWPEGLVEATLVNQYHQIRQ